MSADLLPLKPFEDPLHESIRELRLGHQFVSECLEQTLAECDQLAAELTATRQQSNGMTRSLDDREQQLAQRTQAEAEAVRQCKALQHELEAKRSEIAELDKTVLHAEADEVQAKQRLEIQVEHNQQLRSQIERLESEAESTRTDMTQLRAQLGPLVESATDAVKLRGELERAQADNLRLRGLVDSAASTGEVELGKQLAAAQRERERLEAELDLVQRRAAELATTLTEQGLTIAKEREQWNEEFHHLRHAVERQSEILIQDSAKRSDGAEAGDRLLQAQMEAAQATQRLEVQVEHNQQLQRQIERLEAEAEMARNDLGEIRAQVGPLVESAADAVKLRGELERAQAETLRLRDLLESAAPRSEAILDAQLAAAQLEHDHLAAELNLLRKRDAELSTTLAEQAQIISKEREQWNEELQQLRHAVEQQSAFLVEDSAKRSDIADASDRLLQAQTEGAQTRQRLEMQVEHNQQLRSQVERLESEAETTRNDLAQIRGQLGPLVESAAAAAKLRGELETAQAETLRLRQLLDSAASQGTPDLGKQLASAQLEREQLEAELDLLRNRGAELSTTLAEQNRTITKEREQWKGELQQLRHAVDQQSTILVENLRRSGGNQQSPVQEPARTSPSRNAQADDLVVDSVLEQFAALQKQKIRKASGTAG